MAEKSDIITRFGADIGPLKKGVVSAKGKLKQFSSSTRSSANALGKLTLAAGAAGAAIGVTLVKKSLDAIDSQAKLARQLNTTVASIATLDRAAAMSGITLKNIEAGAKNLDVAMGEAASGTGVAVDTLERLNLTTKDLEGMTLDQKILAVNKAIRENIPASQQASAASDLFGKKAGFAIAQLNPTTIAEAKRQVIGFGVAMTDVDAAKIENANDAMATIGLAVTGVSNQFTVTLSPILEQIANDFKEAAIQTGGFQQSGVEAVKGVATAIGFLGNAFRGIEVIIDGLDVGISSIKAGFLELGGIFSSSMAEAAKVAQGETTLAIAELNATLMEPLPSEVVDAYIAKLTDSRIIDAKRTQVEQLAAIDEQEGYSRVSREEEVQSSLEKLRKGWGKKQTSAVGNLFGDLATLQESGSKKMFEVGKASAKAQTVMSTYEGAQKAFTSFAGLGPVGVALGVAAAAAAVAAGGIRLQAINSTSFGGGGSVSAGGASAAPSAAVPSAAAAPAQERNLTISGIDSGSLYTGDQLTNLMDNMRSAQEDGYVLMVGS